MQVNLRKTLAASGITAAFLFVAVPGAEATLILAAQANGTEICAVDNNAFACTFGTVVLDQDPTLGKLALGDAVTPIDVGGLLVLGSVHTSTVGPPLNILNSSSLNVSNPTGAPITANVAVGDTDYFPPVNVAFASGSGTWENADGSQITLEWWNDPSNEQGAEDPFDRPGNLIFTCSDTAVGPADAFACASGPLGVNDPNPFSMTVAFDFTLEPGGELINRGMTEIKPVPEPALLSLFGLGACAAASRLRRRRA